MTVSIGRRYPPSHSRAIVIFLLQFQRYILLLFQNLYDSSLPQKGALADYKKSQKFWMIHDDYCSSDVGRSNGKARAAQSGIEK